MHDIIYNIIQYIRAYMYVYFSILNRYVKHDAAVTALNWPVMIG